MTLRLAIENMDRLPDGGPLRVEVKGRGLDIGRDAHLDWTLPDPSRYVSGKHCEIRYRDNEYWLLRRLHQRHVRQRRRSSASTRPIGCATATGWRSAPT